jgi:hypothetical protein
VVLPAGDDEPAQPPGHADLSADALSTRAASADFTVGHSASITENRAESRSLPSSPGTHEGDQLRSTPSNCAPSAAIPSGRPGVSLPAPAFRVPVPGELDRQSTSRQQRSHGPGRA